MARQTQPENEIRVVLIRFRQLTKIYAGTVAEYEDIRTQYRFYNCHPVKAVAAFKAEAPGVAFEVSLETVLWSHVAVSERGVA